MYVRRVEISPITDAGGAATALTEVVTGRLHAIRYVKASAASYTDGVDFTVTVEKTGEAIMVGTDVNASATFYPRVGVTDAAGAAVTLDGTRLMRDRIAVDNDRIKFVLAAGGDTKTGTFYLVFV